MESTNRFLKAIAADETHGVERTAIGVSPQAVNRYDVRMLQAAGNLGFLDEASSTVGVIGMTTLDLLQSHFTGEFAIFRDEYFTKPSLRIGPKDSEPGS